MKNKRIVQFLDDVSSLGVTVSEHDGVITIYYSEKRGNEFLGARLGLSAQFIIESKLDTHILACQVLDNILQAIERSAANKTDDLPPN